MKGIININDVHKSGSESHFGASDPSKQPQCLRDLIPELFTINSKKFYY